MIYLIIIMCGLNKSCFSVHTDTAVSVSGYTQGIVTKAVLTQKNVLVGNGVDLDELKERAEKEGKLYCTGRNFRIGVTELYPKNGQLYVKQAPPVTEPVIEPRMPIWSYYGDCPSCRRP